MRRRRGRRGRRAFRADGARQPWFRGERRRAGTAASAWRRAAADHVAGLERGAGADAEGARDRRPTDARSRHLHRELRDGGLSSRSRHRRRRADREGAERLPRGEEGPRNHDPRAAQPLRSGARGRRQDRRRSPSRHRSARRDRRARRPRDPDQERTRGAKAAHGFAREGTSKRGARDRERSSRA